jgi:endo-1,4-beta-D-glucanase Y
MNEDGMEFRYAGTDLVDLKEVEWIDISDRDHRALRMAVEKSTHLPLRWVVSKRDPETRERTEIVTSYAQFIPIDGVKTPLNVSRAQNGRQVSQIYLKDCKYNANPSPQLFTRASLEQRSAEVSKKGYKGDKDKK